MINEWTQANKMKLNAEKSKYIIFTRMKEQFSSRFTLDKNISDREEEIKVLGVSLGQNPGCWERNTREIVRRWFSKLSMLTKLKYASMKLHDLVQIYCLFIRSTAELCSVVWHDSLTQHQTKSIEHLQIVTLKILLGEKGPRKPDGHFDYDKAMNICDLNSLFSRREARMVDFGNKCTEHSTLKRLFPLNPAIVTDTHAVRTRELFKVNPARTAAYYKSAIPAIQRRLNLKYCFKPPTL